jgi:hypothetical protein
MSQQIKQQQIKAEILKQLATDKINKTVNQETIKKDGKQTTNTHIRQQGRPF